MQYTKYSILLLMMSAVLHGCVDSGVGEEFTPEVESHYLVVNQTTLDYDASGGGKQVSLSTTQNWAFSEQASWLTISPASGNGSSSISITAQENLSGDEARTSVFYVSSTDEGWAFRQMMSAEQRAAVPYINVSDAAITFQGKASTATINVESNTNWSASGGNDWLTVTVSQDKSTITLAASENLTNEARSANIILSGSTTQTITVIQNIAKISAETQTLTFNQPGGTLALSIESETEWTADATRSWVDVSPAAGSAGNGILSLSTSPNWGTNTRVAYVNLRIGGTTIVEIKLSQGGVELSAADALSFIAMGETKNLSVQSNIEWKVISKPSWVEVSAESGNGNATISMTAANNPDANNRSGEIVIGRDGVTHQAKVQVNQEGKNLTLGSALLQFGDRASSQNLSITTNGAWLASTQQNWISFSPVSGVGNGATDVAVTENNDINIRNGSVLVTVDNLSKTVDVQQQGKFFTVDNTELFIPSTGGVLKVSLTTNDRWTASLENNADWIKLSKASGDDNTEISLTLNDNPSVNPREETLVITPENCQGIRIIVRQAARYLTVNTESFSFFSKGGTSDPVVITTDGMYEITASDTWFTVNKGEGNTFTVTADVNETGHIRNGKVTIKLTDLEEGTMSIEMDVTQITPGGVFTLGDFGDDSSWDAQYNGVVNISIVDFSGDSSWDDSSDHKITITIVGFKTDTSWDDQGHHGIIVTIEGFKGDKSWDGNSGSGSFNHTGYGDDDNYDNDNTTL